MVRTRTLLLIIIVCAVSAVLLLPMLGFMYHPRFILRSRPGVYIGSNEFRNTPVGWQIPADTMVSTSYRSNQTFDLYYMNADVTALSSSIYVVQAGTALEFGLYINGELRGSKTCLTDDTSGRGGWAGHGSSSNGTYGYESLICGVSLFKTPFAAGTLITLTILANHPIWVQVDRSPTVPSYETPNVTGTLPSMIDPSLGYVAPHTVSASVESD